MQWTFWVLVAQYFSSLSPLKQFTYGLLWAFIAALRLSLVVAQGLSSTGSVLWYLRLVSPRHVESSQTGDRIPVPFTGSRILNPGTTRKVLSCLFYW